jgi:hypothetical protein
VVTFQKASIGYSKSWNNEDLGSKAVAEYCITCGSQWTAAGAQSAQHLVATHSALSGCLALPEECTIQDGDKQSDKSYSFTNCWILGT